MVKKNTEHKSITYSVKYKLGQGKEGQTYLVTKKGRRYAMKRFKKQKSIAKIQKEFDFQKKACKYKICPKLYDINLIDKYIVMERMDSHFMDEAKKKNFVITKQQQNRFIEIYKILDKCKIFHNDSNTANYMIKNDQIYIIDFGLAKPITAKLEKKLGSTPNYTLMTIGLVLKLKHFKFPSKSYKYLLDHISIENRAKYGLLN